MFRIVESRGFSYWISRWWQARKLLFYWSATSRKKGDMKLFILHPSISLQCLLRSELVVQCDAKKDPRKWVVILTQWFFLNFIHMQQRCFCSLHGNKTTNVTTLRMKRLQLPQGPSTPAWNAWSLSPSRRAKSDRACCNATVSSWKQWK